MLLDKRSERQGRADIKLKDMRAQNGTTIALNSETRHASSVSKVVAFCSPLRPGRNCGEPTSDLPESTGHCSSRDKSACL